MENTTFSIPVSSGKPFLSIRINPYLFTLTALPCILLLMHPSSIFSMFDGLDPWVYFGYFKDLKQHLKTFPGAYYGTRLPWILVGHIAYKIFTPLVAKYALFFLLYYTSLFSLYGILKRTIGIKTAFLTAILLGVYKHFIISSSSEYIDGIAQAYFLLSLFFLTPDREKSFPKIRFLFSGIFFSLLMFTHIYLVVYLPLIGCFYFYFHRPRRLLLFLNHLSLFLIGYLLITLFLCTINDLLCHHFFFFEPMITWTKNFLNQPNPWWHPLSEWKRILNQYILGMFIFLSSIIALCFYRFLKSNILFFKVVFILNALILLYFQFVKKQPLLEYQYYYTYLTPMLFLALGSLLSIFIESTSTKTYFLTIGCIFIFCLIEPSFSSKIFNAHAKHFSHLWLYFLLLTILFSFTLFLLKKGAFLSFMALCLTLIFANGSITLNSLPYMIGKNIFLSINDAMKTVKDMDSTGNSYFWYNTDEPYYRIMFISTCSTYLWGYRLVNENFPSTEGVMGYPFLDLANKSFFVLTTKPDVSETVQKVLSEKGITVSLLEQSRIKNGKFSFNIFHFKAKKLENNFHP
jgi:hypothetical protein